MPPPPVLPGLPCGRASGPPPVLAGRQTPALPAPPSRGSPPAVPASAAPVRLRGRLCGPAGAQPGREVGRGGLWAGRAWAGTPRGACAWGLLSPACLPRPRRWLSLRSSGRGRNRWVSPSRAARAHQVYFVECRDVRVRICGGFATSPGRGRPGGCGGFGPSAPLGPGRGRRAPVDAGPQNPLPLSHFRFGRAAVSVHTRRRARRCGWCGVRWTREPAACGRAYPRSACVTGVALGHVTHSAPRSVSGTESGQSSEMAAEVAAAGRAGRCPGEHAGTSLQQPALSRPRPSAGALPCLPASCLLSPALSRGSGVAGPRSGVGGRRDSIAVDTH